jgi:hypothetical protein
MSTPFDPPGSQPWEAAQPWDGTDPWAPTQPDAAPAPQSAAGRAAVRRRPITMAIAGLFGGLGAALLLIHFAKIALGTNAPLIVIAIGVVVGIALAYTLPPRRPRGHR